MIRGVESITLFSEDARKLADFYHKKVGMEIVMEAEIGEKGENLFELKTSRGSGFYIVDHAKVKGKNSQPERVIINFEVDDIEEEKKRLKENGVKIIQDIYHVENYGLIATFEDHDGNYFQLVQIRVKS
ncbi:MAG: VOC family protein [bacterium]|nr:VOC family protein [bacterium]